MAIVFKCLAYFIFHHAIGNCLQKACSGMLTVWMFNRYVVHCLARCATGSIHLALSISGAQAAKWVYRERCDLAGAALQVLPVPVFVCRCCCLLCWCSCSVAHTELWWRAVTLWWIDGHRAALGQDSNPSERKETRRDQKGKRERSGAKGERVVGQTDTKQTESMDIWENRFGRRDARNNRSKGEMRSKLQGNKK